MEKNTKVNLNKDINMEMVDINGLVKIVMRDSFTWISARVLGCITGQMEVHIVESGKIKG